MLLKDAVQGMRPRLLALAAAGAAALGATRAVTDPDGFDPMVLRGVLVVALLVAAALVRSASAPVASLWLRGLAWYVAAWVVVMQWGNEFSATMMPTAIPTLVLCVVLFDRAREAAVFIVVACAGLVVGGWYVGQVGPSVGLACSALVTGGVVIGSAIRRSELTRALMRHRSELEAQVEARTEELRHEVVVRRAAEIRAQAASDAKSRFLANMSHELRTPLNAIIGYSELVREVLVDPDGSIKEARSDLRRVIRAADRLLSLVNDVLDLARIEADVMEIMPAPLVLPDLVAEVCDEVRPLAQRRGTVLGVDLELAPPLMRSDASRLRQILVNLVTNAAKFTENGRVEVRATSHEHTVRIDVVDNGVGIPESAMETLFERFTQVDESSTRVHEGTGLGLALSRDLARRMGGELFATSQHGEGSTFTLLLPVDAESTAHLRQAADTSSDDSQPWDPQAGLRRLDAAGV